MAQDKIFVGRKAELEQFKKVLEDPQGQAVLVVGNRGIGKTWLVNKMAELAENHPDFKCGCVRYEVTPTDSVDSTMALMMDNAFEAAQAEEGSFVGTKRRLEQWRSLLNVVNIGDLVMSLRRDPAKNTRDQFLERLQLISKRMPENGRAIFIIDPEKYMQEKSASAWRIVVKDLPHKIKLIFAQRTEDELAKNRAFKALDNVIRIPSRRLGVLQQSEVEELVQLRAEGVRKPQSVLYDSVAQYKGHPYAIQAALDKIKKTRNVENLPKDPTPDAIAETQWDEVCKVGTDAISLFETYAILEVGVPYDVVHKVSGLGTTDCKRLQKRSYLKGLLREEAHGKRIYHSILSDYVLDQISNTEKKKYHSRAVNVYRKRIKESREKQTAPDSLAITRLPEHVLAAEGEMAFVKTFVNECGKDLQVLGFLDAFVSLSERTLLYVEKGSAWQASILSNLGLVYRTRGNLGMAEKMFTKALEIDEKLRRLENMAGEYGNLGLIYITSGDMEKAEQMLTKALKIHQKLSHFEGSAIDYGNLGLFYRKCGDLDKAEQMHKKSLEINEKLRQLEGMASQYGNLGLIYQARGDLDKAEEMYTESLKTHKQFGWLEGVASSYGNLGVVYKERNDFEKAREYWEKALELFKKMGMNPEIEKTQQSINELDKKGKKEKS